MGEFIAFKCREDSKSGIVKLMPVSSKLIEQATLDASLSDPQFLKKIKDLVRRLPAPFPLYLFGSTRCNMGIPVSLVKEGKHNEIFWIDGIVVQTLIYELQPLKVEEELKKNFEREFTIDLTGVAEATPVLHFILERILITKYTT